MSRKERGLNQMQLAEISGVESHGTISRYERGERTPDWHVIENLSKALRVPPEWLVYGVIDSSKPDGFPVPLPSDDMRVPEQEEYASIPRYDASFSAGHGAVLDPHAEPLGWYKFEMQWLRSITLAGIEYLAVVRVRGDSMEPTLSDGDWVLMDGSQKTISQEGMYAIHVGDSAWIKRLSLRFSTRKIRIISDNERYGEEEVMEDDLHIVGRVIAIVARRV